MFSLIYVLDRRWWIMQRKRGRDRTKTKFHAPRASLFLAFFPFAFGESKTAPVRFAEKVMDRALNVGSHGIQDVDTRVAPIGWYRTAPTI